MHATRGNHTLGKTFVPAGPTSLRLHVVFDLLVCSSPAWECVLPVHGFCRRSSACFLHGPIRSYVRWLVPACSKSCCSTYGHGPPCKPLSYGCLWGRGTRRCRHEGREGGEGWVGGTGGGARRIGGVSTRGAQERHGRAEPASCDHSLTDVCIVLHCMRQTV